MKKKFEIFIILIIMGFLITGCSLSSENNEPVVLEPGNENTLTIGVDNKFPPLSYLDENNNIVGFDIDLAKEAAQKLGMELNIQPITWSEKETELLNGNIDAIWSGFSMTPERSNEILFTEPYLTNNQVVIVKDDSNINTLNDLTGKTVGIQKASSSESSLAGNLIVDSIKRIIPYEETISALDDLAAGRIDAVVVDSVIADWYLNNHNEELTILGEPLSTGFYSIGVSPENADLVTQLNDVLWEIKTDGTGSEISTKWFGSDILYNPQ